jgi:hypothetical protein
LREPTSLGNHPLKGAGAMEKQAVSVIIFEKFVLSVQSDTQIPEEVRQRISGLMKSPKDIDVDGLLDAVTIKPSAATEEDDAQM